MMTTEIEDLTPSEINKKMHALMEELDSIHATHLRGVSERLRVLRRECDMESDAVIPHLTLSKEQYKSLEEVDLSNVKDKDVDIKVLNVSDLVRLCMLYNTTPNDILGFFTD